MMQPWIWYCELRHATHCGSHRRRPDPLEPGDAPHEPAQPPPRRLPGRGPRDRLRRGRARQPRPVHRQRRAARHRPGPAHGNLADLSWILNAYAIVYAALLVLLGRLAESRRRDTGFLLGVVLFTAASAACGAAGSLGMLVAFRIVQAVGAALLTPTSLSLVLATTPPEGRSGAVRAWTAIGGLAAALGPVVGGLLVAPAGAGCSWSTSRSGSRPWSSAGGGCPPSPGHPGPRPDALGAALITLGVAALTLGLVKGNDWGWGSAATVAVLAVAVVALALFALRIARAANPLDRRPRCSGPRLLRRLAGVADLLDRVRRDAALDRALVPGGVGMVGAQHRPRRRPGPLMVPLFALPARRAADRALRPGPGDRRSAPPCSPPGSSGGRWPPGSRPTTPARCSVACC